MTRLPLPAALLLLISLVGPTPTAAQPIDVPALFTWEANLEGGYGRALRDPDRVDAWFARARGGLLYARDNDNYMGGLIVDLADHAPVAFGLQGEYLHLETGLWFQLGGVIDVEGEPGFVTAAGWSLVGVEVQSRIDDDQRFWVVMGKLRLPIRHIVLALTGQ